MDIFVRSLKISQYMILCLVPSLQADVIEYYSPNTSGSTPNYPLHNLYADGIRIEESTSITFQLKSEHFSYILLQKNQADYKYNVVEIVLSSRNNEGATITDKQNIVFDTFHREKGLVSPTEYRYFWISWTNSTVRIGKGNTNQQEFMNWTHLTFDIKFISIGTAGRTTGYWKFTTGTSDFIEYHTYQTSCPNYTQHNLDDDGIGIKMSTSIIFQLKSEAFSYILLQENQTNYSNNVVEIALGSTNNEGATISDKKNTLSDTKYYEKNILSTSEYRHFWISWANSTVRVGKGNTTNQQEFMHWPHLTFGINYISIGTAYYANAYWRFTKVSETTVSTQAVVSTTATESHISTIESEKSISTAAVVSTTTTEDHFSTVVSISTQSRVPMTQSPSITTVISTTAEREYSENQKQESSLVAVYVSITCVVVIIIITGVIIVFFLRRRKKNIRRQESAMYSKNDPKIERKPVSIVVNKEYDNHSLEKDLSFSEDNNYNDISLKEEPLTKARKYEYSTVNKTATVIVADEHDTDHDEFNYTKVNPRARGNVEDDYGYNHLNTNRQQKINPLNYSTMVMGTNSMKADVTDTMYSHIGTHCGTKGHSADVEAENTYNKLNVRRSQNELFEENEKTVYNHAGTGVRYPDINDTDDYSHLD